MPAGQQNVRSTWRVPIGRLANFPIPDGWLYATLTMPTKEAALQRLRDDDAIWYGSNVEFVRQRKVSEPVTPFGGIEWDTRC